MKSIRDHRITILGAAKSGIAAATLLKKKGASVFVSDYASPNKGDLKILKKNGIKFEIGGHSDQALNADLTVISPGIPSSAPIVQKMKEKDIPIYSEIEMASWFVSQPIVAITGTNGKTTTTSLTGWVFKKAGESVEVAGNIGKPFSSVVDDIDEKDAIAVLEISSFQLDYVDQFRPRVSVILNITPDHLNRYDNSFEKYAQSKFRIAKNQGRGDTIILNRDDPVLLDFGKKLRKESDAKILFISLKDMQEEGAFRDDKHLSIRYNGLTTKLLDTEKLALRGEHNTYNSLAAAMAARVVELGSDSIRESLETFPGLSHRLEEVRELQGVLYVNDSKATNVNAMWYALGSFNRPIILIAGGRDKGNDYGIVKELIQDHVKSIIAIGEGADRILEELAPFAEQSFKLDTMTDAVKAAQMMSDEGDVILLSPACSSFDMYDNFEQRGDVFKDIVNGLSPRQPNLFQSR